MSVLKVTTFVQTTALNVKIHLEAMNVYARKDIWKLTASVSLMIPAWVWTVTRMLFVILFGDVYARMVSKAMELVARTKTSAILLEVRVT